MPSRKPYFTEWVFRSRKSVWEARVREVGRNSDDLVSESTSFYWPLETLLLCFRSGERSGNVLLLIPTPRPMISTPSNPCPSLSLSFYFFDQDTQFQFPYSALIDRERYTKLACIEVSKTRHSLEKEFLPLLERKTIGKRSDIFSYSRWFLSIIDLSLSPSLISFFSHEIARSKKKKEKEIRAEKRSKFFNSKLHSSSPKKCILEKRYQLARGEVSLTNETVSFNNTSIFSPHSSRLTATCFHSNGWKLDHTIE